MISQFGHIHIKICGFNKLPPIEFVFPSQHHYNCPLSPLRITPRKFDTVPARGPQSPARTAPDLSAYSNLTLSRRDTRTSLTFRKIRHEPCGCGEDHAGAQCPIREDCIPIYRWIKPLQAKFCPENRQL